MPNVVSAERMRLYQEMLRREDAGQRLMVADFPTKTTYIAYTRWRDRRRRREARPPIRPGDPIPEAAVPDPLCGSERGRRWSASFRRRRSSATRSPGSCSLDLGKS